MTLRLAILCPGQGAQHAGMFNFACSGLDVDSLFAQWKLESALGMQLTEALHNSAAIFSNRIAQPLIVASALANWSAIKDALPQPTLVAGYSIGELSAYGIADALSATEAIRIAALRARLMDDCVQIAPHVMLAISGLNRKTAHALTRSHGFFIAIETGEENVIAGGLSDAATAVEHDVLKLGGHVTRLPVNIASHTPLMHAAVAPFMQALRTSSLGNPLVPVLAGVSGEAVYDKEKAITTLSHQLEDTIRWIDCMDACAEAGITIALELGPGAALARMLQTRHPHIVCRSIADFRTPAGVRAWMERHAE